MDPGHCSSGISSCCRVQPRILCTHASDFPLFFVPPLPTRIGQRNPGPSRILAHHLSLSLHCRRRDSLVRDNGWMVSHAARAGDAEQILGYMPMFRCFRPAI